MINHLKSRLNQRFVRKLFLAVAVLIAAVTAVFCLALWFEFDHGGLAAAAFSGALLLAVSYLAEKHMDLRPLLVD